MAQSYEVSYFYLWEIYEYKHDCVFVLFSTKKKIYLLN